MRRDRREMPQVSRKDKRNQFLNWVRCIRHPPIGAGRYRQWLPAGGRGLCRGFLGFLAGSVASDTSSLAHFADSSWNHPEVREVQIGFPSG
jgi:hypothetical protein